MYKKHTYECIDKVERHMEIRCNFDGYGNYEIVLLKKMNFVESVEEIREKYFTPIKQYIISLLPAPY